MVWGVWLDNGAGTEKTPTQELAWDLQCAVDEPPHETASAQYTL
jgi:hypothetical protein